MFAFITMKFIVYYLQYKRLPAWNYSASRGDISFGQGFEHVGSRTRRVQYFIFVTFLAEGTRDYAV